MREFFPDVSSIDYEGPDSKNPLAFKYYDPDQKVGDKTMKEHLRFAVAYWHSFTGSGADPFGDPTMQRPWDHATTPMELAKLRVEAGFEFMQKLGVPYFCFHDRDIAPEGNNLSETNKNLDIIADLIRQQMERTGIKLLWGTAQLFVHPRFVHGAATSPNADVFAYSAAQVKKAMEVTKDLGGENYVFWGGREGYDTLLNTDMKLEQDNLARFLHMAVDYAEKIGFKGQFLIEPKPQEPTTHQYDSTAAVVIGFLEKYDLADHFKLNIEANHATLAGLSFEHELHVSRIHGMLGSIDANRGEVLLGWDTDNFPTDVYATTLAMYEVLKNGGLQPGGLNFDAKVRRASFEPNDLFDAHIAGMDAFAHGLKVAHALLEGGELESFISERYKSYTEGIGQQIVNSEVGFEELEAYAMERTIENTSGRQERLEAILNQYILNQSR